MELNRIQAALIEIATAYVAKTGRQPNTQPHLTVREAGNNPISVHFYGRDYNDFLSFRSGESIEAACLGALAAISAWQDAHTIALTEYRDDLAKLLERGDDLGLDTKPMRAVYEALTENLLTSD